MKTASSGGALHSGSGVNELWYGEDRSYGRQGRAHPFSDLSSSMDLARLCHP
ncbi:MAG TPA: hypothetical protein VGF37_11480 [Chthoniobacterales bacterium]